MVVPIDEVMLEHRLTQMEAEMRRIADATERLADHVRIQNGRIGKIEQRNIMADAFAAGQAALRKRDLAYAGATFTFLGILVSHIDTVLGWF